jgi:glycosyltransferase involved in cell wall biosynthesis
MLRAAISVPCRLADVTFAVSASLAQRVCVDGLGSANKIRVLGAGSANGVDVTHFSPESVSLGRSTRSEHAIPEDVVVIGFVGRLTRDKGVEELAEAFRIVYEHAPNTILLVVGPYEDRDRPSERTVQTLSTHPGVRQVGLRFDVLRFMAAMDIVALPTYREGLGNVLLEAAALGLPTVTTNATGARDAVLDGRTGLQVPVGDADALARALLRLVGEPNLRREMGQAGRKWVVEEFDQQKVWVQQVDEYRALMHREQPSDRMRRSIEEQAAE